MREDSNSDSHGLFYLELPQAEYLSDIEIQDEYEIPSYDNKQGLSDAQVSEIARDSLKAAAEQTRLHNMGNKGVAEIPADMR